jgi:hypothetical protein
VLKALGHTPESFARVVGRNASGLRRAIRGETKMNISTVKEIVEGLRKEGWGGDPFEIRQLRLAAPRTAITQPEEKERAGREPPRRSSQARVRLALGELMRALGREEVDRVYARVFGAKPNEKDN